MADDLIVHETVRVGSKRYELSLRQQSRFVWLAHGKFEGEALEGRGHSPRGAAQRWLEKAWTTGTRADGASPHKSSNERH